MILSRYNLKNIQSPDLQVPPDSVFDLPEKVLQFGTGVLLRGLPDYFIDKANRSGIFNGRIVVVKSTSAGGTDEFDKQDGLFTLCVRGIEDGNKIKVDNYPEWQIKPKKNSVLWMKNPWNEKDKLMTETLMKTIDEGKMCKIEWSDGMIQFNRLKS